MATRPESIRTAHLVHRNECRLSNEVGERWKEHGVAEPVVASIDSELRTRSKEPQQIRDCPERS